MRLKRTMAFSSSHYILLLSFIVSYASSVTPGKLVDLMNVHDPAWESHLESSLVVLESNCHENDIPFDRVKVKEDLTACLHPIITQQLTYNINFAKPITQEEVFRHVYIEPICNKISSSISCLKPHKKALESCIRDDGKAVSEFMKHACRNNGSILVEFVQEGGIDCISEHKDPFTNCLEALGDKSSMTNDSAQVCQYFREVRDCTLTTLHGCKKTRPAKIIRAIFDEVNKDIGGNCLAFGVADPVSGSSSMHSPSSYTQLWTVLSACTLMLFYKIAS